MLPFLERLARRPLVTLAALTGLFALTYLIGTAVTTGPEGPLVQGDARFYFAYLPSLVLDQDLDLTDELEVLFPGREDPRGVDRPLNPFPLHPALVWLPGYVVGLTLDAATDGLSTGQPLGFGPAASWGAALFSILAAGIAAGATFLFLSGMTDPRTALLATVLTWLGTPAVYYTLVTPLYSHTTAWAAVAAMAAVVSTRDRAGGAARWLVVGLVGGFAVGARLQDLPLLAVPGVVLLSELHARRESALRDAIAWTAGLVAGYLPQGVNWYLMYRTLIPVEPKLDIAEQVTSPAGQRLWEILFSTGYQGWWSWSPLVPLCLVGCAFLLRNGPGRSRVVMVGALVGLAGMLFLDVVHPYGPGASFGGRRYVSFAPFLAMGLAAIVSGAGAHSKEPAELRLRGPAYLALALTAWQLVVLLSYELLVIRHGHYPTLAETVRHALGGGAP